MRVNILELESGDLIISEDTRFIQWGIAVVISVHIGAFIWLVVKGAEIADFLQATGIILFLTLAICLVKRTKCLVFSLSERSLFYKYHKIFSFGPLTKKFQLDLIEEIKIKFSEIDSESRWVTISFKYSRKNTKISLHHADRKEYDQIIDELKLWLLKNNLERVKVI